MQSLLRLLFMAPVALFITFILLILMVSLIEFSDKKLNESERIKLPDILMPETEISVQRIVEKPEKPEIDDTPPPEIPQQDFDVVDGNAAVGEVASPNKVTANLDLSIGAGLEASDGEYLPIVKVAPVYPHRAAERGIEGYVVLEYTVTKKGTVESPIVIESKPSKTFDKAAIKSALRYKYKPRVENGQPVAVSGVRTKVTFKLAR